MFDVMKRTLLAVGIALLASMMLIPRGENGVQMWLPFFFDTSGATRFGTDYWQIRWTPFILQTVFIAIAVAVIVNLFPRRPRK
jgi:hypothetical protein